MEAVIQRARMSEETVLLVMTTHDTEEAAMVGALDAIFELESCVEPPRVIRIEPF
jgi:homoserine dehydrogenase